jgi:hypothetical protein
MLHSESIDVENDLQEHVLRAVSLENDELSASVSESEPLIEAVRSWASSHDLQWDGVDLHGIRVAIDGELVIEFESNQYEHTMDTSFESINSGTISWTREGFAVKECVNDWEEARRIDAECDAMMDSDDAV